jgi:hypothetical protein
MSPRPLGWPRIKEKKRLFQVRGSIYRAKDTNNFLSAGKDTTHSLLARRNLAEPTVDL